MIHYIIEKHGEFLTLKADLTFRLIIRGWNLVAFSDDFQMALKLQKELEGEHREKHQD